MSMENSQPKDEEPIRPETSSISIAIVGGGVIGLIVAHGLLQIGVRVTIYERASNFHEVGAGISFPKVARDCMTRLSPAVIEAMERVGLRNNHEFDYYWDGYHTRRNSASSDADRNIINDTDPEGTSCDLLFKRTNRKLDYWGCLRADFLDNLAASLPPDVTHFNKQFTAYTDPSPSAGPVTLHFSDGTSATADAIIGCDGLRSRVRAQLLASTAPEAILPTYSHQRCYRAVVARSATESVIGQEKASRRCAHIGPGAHVMSYPVNDSLVNLIFFHADANPWPHTRHLTLPGKREDIVNAVEGWSSAVRGLVSLFPKEPLVWGLFDMYEHPAPSYVEPGQGGRVCIAGDSAHASTPHHGAGAAMGVEDALALTTVVKLVVEKLEVARTGSGDERESLGSLMEVKAKCLASALKTFSDVRYERSQWLVKSSREGGLIFNWRYPGSMDDPVEIQRELDERLDKIWTFDIEGMVDEVRSRFSDAFDGVK
ncbi:unnamed protein product [Periconia digitata]|uniref:FAD-binding domain-containing protein n=1 Tax=Periconia digitata TaxID=1303443 RepID=A0A9W4XM83_9PLEO|nr:unnamed protein product [Periconia digitata]